MSVVDSARWHAQLPGHSSLILLVISKKSLNLSLLCSLDLVWKILFLFEISRSKVDELVLTESQKVVAESFQTSEFNSRSHSIFEASSSLRKLSIRYFCWNNSGLSKILSGPTVGMTTPPLLLLASSFFKVNKLQKCLGEGSRIFSLN